MYRHRTMNVSTNNPDVKSTFIPQPQIKFASCDIYVNSLNENIRPNKSVNKKESSKFYLKNVLQSEQRYPKFSRSKHTVVQTSEATNTKIYELLTFLPLLNPRLKAACYLYPAIIYLQTSAAQETRKLALNVDRWDAEWRQRRGPSRKCRAAKTRKGRHFQRRSPPGFCHACAKFLDREWAVCILY